KPRRKSMPRVILHCAHFGSSAEGVGNPLGCALVIGRESDAYMAIVENRMVWPIGAFELIQALRDEETTNPVTGHESKLALEEVEPAESCEFIEHEQQSLLAPIGIQAFGKSSPNLIDQEPHQRFCPSDIGWGHHEI